VLVLFSFSLNAQPWQQNDDIFNSSGVPSLPFSQPRFADLDGDGDQDMILGNLNDASVYLENLGTPTNPAFAPGFEIFTGISPLDAEMGVCADLDNDGDLDFAMGNYPGTFNYFENQHFIVDIDLEQAQTNSYKLCNYPNPFRNSTNISFITTRLLRQLADTPLQAESTEIKIYNIKGQLVRELKIKI